MKQNTAEYWEDRLVCEIVRIQHNFKTHKSIIHFPAANCCDMSGCIRLFERIDKDVVQIKTFSGRDRDTMYKKNQNGIWQAYLSRRRVLE